MITNILFGLAGGLLTASWGAFKDSRYEGFSGLSFTRSLVTTLIYYLVLTIGSVQYYTHSFLVLFSAIALERITQEYWKAFFRKSNSSQIYKIPQSFHILGKVQAYPRRLIIGLVVTTITICIIFYLHTRSFSSTGWIIPALLFAIVPTFGGAWKDAPTEGFQIAKFPRSFLVMFISAAILHRYTNNVLILILGSAGLERIIVEFYKTFIVQATPGKFISKIRYSEWTSKRNIFKISYAISVIIILMLWQ